MKAFLAPGSVCFYLNKEIEMKIFVSFLVAIFSVCSGCQLQPTTAPTSVIKASELGEHENTNNFFIKGMHLAELDKAQQQIQCEQLKLKYQTKPEWQTAWLLVYPLNDDFHCLSLNETIDYLQTLVASTEIYPQLAWLNKNQLKILKQLLKYQKKSISLRRQLKEAQKRLKEVNSKIQALKAIETSINKKLDGQ